MCMGPALKNIEKLHLKQVDLQKKDFHRKLELQTLILILKKNKGAHFKFALKHVNLALKILVSTKSFYFRLGQWCTK